ncbi:hypothetical protein HY379_02210 [Candidatus Saccharibacteria bacterium]|nr:hypothetical protein [Candidatus Saccharibacteria bacterium]
MSEVVCNQITELQVFYCWAYFVGGKLRIHGVRSLLSATAGALTDWWEIRVLEEDTMKPAFQVFETVEVVNVHGKAVAIVGGTRRTTPRFELRLWGYDFLGQIVILARTWTDWVETTHTEIHRPCHTHIVPIVRSLGFKAGLALGKKCFGDEIRLIDGTSGLFTY